MATFKRRKYGIECIYKGGRKRARDEVKLLKAHSPGGKARQSYFSCCLEQMGPILYFVTQYIYPTAAIYSSRALDCIFGPHSKTLIKSTHIKKKITNNMIIIFLILLFFLFFLLLFYLFIYLIFYIMILFHEVQFIILQQYVEYVMIYCVVARMWISAPAIFITFTLYSCFAFDSFLISR